VERVQTTPGRLVHALETASYDAWIKFYRPDENSLNTTISYYTKGAVVAWLLDARIQGATAGSKTLDDVLHLAYKRYAGARGFTPEEFQALAQDVAGVDLAPWFASTLTSTEELDYTQALEWFGLRFTTQGTPANKAWMGVSTRTDNGRLVVTQVPRHTPAWESGVNVEDEILAIDEHRVRPEHWGTRLEQYQPGEQVSLLLARRDRLKRCQVTLAAEPPKGWKLAVHPETSQAQRDRLAAWLRAYM
jgi:predicted metalloprotease with PDZ domain